MKRSLFKAAISIIIILLSATSLLSPQVLADKVITIPPRTFADRPVFVIANFTVGKGTEIAYSFNASDVVDFLVTGHYVDRLSELVCFLQIANASANGTFIAPFDGYTYRFAFEPPLVIPGHSIQVTYDIHEVKPPLPLGLSLLLVVATLAIIGFIVALVLARY